MKDELPTVDEAARYMRMQRRTIRRLYRARELELERHCPRTAARILRSELDACF
jgi:excisionase family DNA binding protein